MTPAEEGQIDRSIGWIVRHSAISYDLVEDAKQEAWLGALGAMDRFRRDGGAALSTFVMGRARGQILDFLRREDPLTRSQRKKVRAGTAMPLQFAPESSLAELSAPCESDPTARIDVLRLLGGLNCAQRRVVVGMYLEERSTAEVAKNLGVPTGQVLQVKAEAMRRMRARALRPHA
jgi:RNA polymerase sigma factor (sigma-70 family)